MAFDELRKLLGLSSTAVLPQKATSNLFNFTLRQLIYLNERVAYQCLLYFTRSVTKSRQVTRI
jgi:hypothetical protein